MLVHGGLCNNNGSIVNLLYSLLWLGLTVYAVVLCFLFLYRIRSLPYVRRIGTD